MSDCIWIVSANRRFARSAHECGQPIEAEDQVPNLGPIHTLVRIFSSLSTQVIKFLYILTI